MLKSAIVLALVSQPIPASSIQLAKDYLFLSFVQTKCLVEKGNFFMARQHQGASYDGVPLISLSRCI